MTQKDLKHALISLCLGVAITAATTLINGLLHLCLQWLSGLVGGAATTVSYLNYKHLI